MADKETTETAETPAEAVAKKAKGGAKDKSKAKTKTKQKATAPAKAPRDKEAGRAASAEADFDFVGKVESLRAGDGAGFEFALKGRRGRRRSFRLEAADPFVMNAMAHMVLAAHSDGSKIGVRTVAEAEGLAAVREVESRPRLRRGD